MLNWQLKAFQDLSLKELYALLKLRQDVFIVEQNCPYPDADGYDLQAQHLLGWNTEDLQAYLRIVPAGLKYAEASLGRIVTAPASRGLGLGKALMQEALTSLDQENPCALRISAQAHLEKFYQGFGFQTVSTPYDEDGIPHIEMLRAQPDLERSSQA